MFQLDEEVERAKIFECRKRESGKRSVPRNQEKTIEKSRSQEEPEGKLEIWESVMGKGWLVIIHIMYF